MGQRRFHCWFINTNTKHMFISKNAKSAMENHSAELLKHATPRQLLDELLRQNPDLLFEHVVKNDRDKVIELVIGDQRKPIGFDMLEFRFIDSNGLKYYGFPKDMPIPIERFGKMRDFEMWMTVGISPSEFKSVIDVCNKSWVATLKTKKNHERVGLLLEELRMRCDMVMHTDLLFNFLAVQWIREDENPEKFDASIQDAKVEQFKKETGGGNTYGFFHQPELIRFNELYNFTPDEWVTYWKESEAKQLYLRAALKKILSDTESENETTISMKD